MAEGDRRKATSRQKGASQPQAEPGSEPPASTDPAAQDKPSADSAAPVPAPAARPWTPTPLRAPGFAGSTLPQHRPMRPPEHAPVPAAQAGPRPAAGPAAGPGPSTNAVPAVAGPGPAGSAVARPRPGVRPAGRSAARRRTLPPAPSSPMAWANWATIKARLAPPTSPDAPVLVLAALVAVAFVWYSFLNGGHRASLDYYVPLADAFLHGRLYVIDHPSYLNELVPFAGQYYVVYPPIPAVLLMPIVLIFGPGFDQARASIVLGALDVALAGAVAYRVVGPRRWVWVLFAIMFGFGTTVWYSVASGNSWHFAHVCATTFLLLAVLDTQRNGPPWRIGLLLGCAVLSRLPTALAVPFFLGYFAWAADRQPRVGPGDETFGALGGKVGSVLSSRLDWRQLILDVVSFGCALSIPLILYAMYNQARFGDPLQEGYSLIPGLLKEFQYRYGFLAIESIGRNLYAMLMSMPKQVDSFPFIQPRNLGGLSIFLTTPAFLWAFRAHRPSWFVVGAWISILAITVPIILHADPGGAEFGYRYAIDFYPFVFLLMIHGMRGRMNAERWAAMALCFLVNIWGMYAVMTGWLA
jgi:hypothetical protein